MPTLLESGQPDWRARKEEQLTLLIVILLIAAAASGVLWSVLEVAFWIALVFFLAISALVVFGYLAIRRRTS